MSRFTVFDVETPNRMSNRKSAIGVTVIEDGMITDEFYSLVNPETHFDYYNTQLTGHAQATMATDRYPHIMDDDRRLNAERLEEAFYGGKSEKPENSSPGDMGVSNEAIELAKAIGNSPELMALLKGLLKNNN